MSEFDQCLRRGGLKPFPRAGSDTVKKEIDAARQDLADAEFLADNEMPKRTTITAYYSMFHAARAAVLARGYTEKSHHCLLVAFREFYADDDDGRELARGIERARVLRENADYQAEFSADSARAPSSASARGAARRSATPPPGAAGVAGTPRTRPAAA